MRAFDLHCVVLGAALTSCALRTPQSQTAAQREAANEQYAKLHGDCTPEHRWNPERWPREPSLPAPRAVLLQDVAPCFEANDSVVSVKVADGVVELLTDPGEPASEPVAACVAERVVKWKMATSEGEVFITASHGVLAASYGSVPGFVDKDEIRAAVRRQLKHVRRCFDDALAYGLVNGGRVVVRFSIDLEGKVHEVGLFRNETGSELTGCCIVSAMRRWKMPVPRAGYVYVEYPFLLQ